MRARHCWGRHIGMKQFPKNFQSFRAEKTWEHVLCLWPTLCSLTHHPGLSLNKGSPGGGSPFTRARHCWGRHIGIKQLPKIFKVLGHKNMGTRAVSVAYTLQPDPPPWTLPEQGISRGWEPIHKGQALLG